MNISITADDSRWDRQYDHRTMVILGVRTVGGVGVTLVAIFARVPDAISAPRAGTVDAAHVWRVGVGQTVVALLAEPCIVDPVAARCEPLPEASSLHVRRLGG